MTKRKQREFWESAELNNRTYLHYYNRLTELAISMFEWKNLPETVDARYLELCLFSHGSAIFFKDDVLGYLALKMTMRGGFNVYHIPKQRRAYASNGYNINLNDKNSVIIFNNMLHGNCIPDIEHFARKLYECDRTIDVNIKAQKTPVAILCDENQRLSMKNLYMQYDGNQPFIFGGKDLDIKKIQCITTSAPFVADKVMQTKFQIWNEAMTYLGISNVNMHKKERLLNDEVTRNMGSTVASRYTRLDMRKQACSQINSMFGLDIDVDYRDDIVIVESADQIQDEEGNTDNE